MRYCDPAGMKEKDKSVPMEVYDYNEGHPYSGWDGGYGSFGSLPGNIGWANGSLGGYSNNGGYGSSGGAGLDGLICG